MQKPSPLPPDREPPAERSRSRTSYDWASIELGVWQCWLDLRGQDIDNAEALRQCTRVRVAALYHARSRGLTVASRRIEHGRVLDLRFTK